MRNLILSTAIAGTAFASESAPIFTTSYPHDFTVKGFYRQHSEGGYNYKTGGVGLEYNLNPDEGFIFKISTITNLKEHNVLVETENQLGYKFIVHENHTIYPLISTRFSSHHIGREDYTEGAISIVKDIFVNKTTAFVGFGWEVIPEQSFRFKIEGLLFRDLHNALLTQANDRFWGRSYSNPSGYKVKAGISSQFGEVFLLNLDSSYIKTFQKDGYEEIGAELSFKWCF